MVDDKPIKIKGLAVAMDGSGRLTEVEIEITDPEMIRESKEGLVKDFSIKEER